MPGFKGGEIRIPLNRIGFQYNRNEDLEPLGSLVEPTKNINFHEGGAGKRGGSAKTLTVISAEAVRGLFDWRQKNGTNQIIYAKADGKAYDTNDNNVIQTGMSTQNFVHFSQFNDEVYGCDESTTPWRYGGGAAQSVLAPSEWASESAFPFMMVPHARGANSRNWAITRKGVWASKANEGYDFQDASVRYIPIFSAGRLLGAMDFGGTLFVWDGTKGYVIDDSNSDSSLWGYREVQWDGGLANFRLVAKAGNDLLLMGEDLIVYSLRAVQKTGDYEAVALTRPAHIDRWIREKVSTAGINNFHMIYDRQIRAVRIWVGVSSVIPNQCLLYFIDNPPDLAWIIHDNLVNPSGLTATVSAEVRVSPGNYEIWTGDVDGNIWRLEQASRSDDGMNFVASLKPQKFDFGAPTIWKYFRKGAVTVRATGNFNVTLRLWIDGNRLPDQQLSLSGSGAKFDEAQFDSDVFAEEQLIPVEFDIGDYGYDIQVELINQNSGEDMFASEIVFDVLPMGRY